MKKLFVILLIGALFILGLACSALGIAAVGAVFLERPFWWSYHRAWERWGWLIVFSLFVFGSHGGRSR